MPCARPPVKEELPSSRNRHRLPLPSVFERQFDSAGHRNTLFPRHCSPMAISLSTVTETQLIAAFARFSGIRVKVSAGIHAVCLRVRGRLTLCLCGIRNDRNDTYRKASNQAHGNLPRAMGRRAILSKDRRLARLRSEHRTRRRISQERSHSRLYDRSGGNAWGCGILVCRVRWRTRARRRSVTSRALGLGKASEANLKSPVTTR